MSADPSDLISDARAARGYVIILPGVEGHSFLNRRIRTGLAQAEVPYALEIYDWTRGWPGVLCNLRLRSLHRRQTRKIVQKIRDYQAEHPGLPVFLIGHSGGGGMCLNVLAALETAETITGAILLGPAISPRYDLHEPLKHVDRGVWNFSSHWDALMLGFFTIMMGTIDGRHAVSAGCIGFAAAANGENRSLHEVPFQSRFLRWGNWGGHFGYTSPRFVQNVVAPLLSEPAECPPPECERGTPASATPPPS